MVPFSYVVDNMDIHADLVLGQNWQKREAYIISWGELLAVGQFSLEPKPQAILGFKVAGGSRWVILGLSLRVGACQIVVALP